MKKLSGQRKIYLHSGVLVSCLGATLQQATSALRQSPPPVDWITTNITGDSSRTEEKIPYRLLHTAAANKNSLDDLQARAYVVLESVIEQALSEAKLSEQAKQKTAIFLGSSSFLIGASEQLYKQELNTNHQEAISLRDSRFGPLALRVAQKFNLRGGCYTFNTACTASANALFNASKMMQTEQIEHAIVVATELFNETTLLGFNSLELLTRTGMRPFDRRRNGLELGEACAAVVLSSAPTKNQRPFHIVSGANLCDTFSISAANPDGSTVYRVMQMALDSAGVSSKDIVAIKTHGTASLMNDDAESSGLRLCFPVMPLLCTLKPYLGHTLGACGLSELLLFCHALRSGFLPALVDDFESDDKLGIQLNKTPADPGRGLYMLNYFGFGGNNTSLILSDDH